MACQHPKTPEPLTCEETREQMPEYISCCLEHDLAARLREHLAGCLDCSRAYRESVGTMAALSRMTTAERDKRMLERQRNARHAKAFEHGEEPKPEPRRRNFRLRMVLIPAVVIYAVIGLCNLPPEAGRVQITEASGTVHIDAREVNLELGPALVLPGRWILTDRFAKACVDARFCELRVGSGTDLLVESARPLRLRLRAGSLSLVGSALFVTVLGIVEVEEGRGTLRLTDHGLEVEPESGSWRLIDKDGSSELDLGRAQSFTMEL
ncbi:MAG: hypothetical protein ABGY71_15070 [bacterium]|nr:zf-HC2 domain-containing protein [Planctomycetota bacterium]HIL51578.1 zf-HC2 domain-containing protein [Planctomycetota bacterium]